MKKYNVSQITSIIWPNKYDKIPRKHMEDIRNYGYIIHDIAQEMYTGKTTEGVTLENVEWKGASETRVEDFEYTVHCWTEALKKIKEHDDTYINDVECEVSANAILEEYGMEIRGRVDFVSKEQKIIRDYKSSKFDNSLILNTVFQMSLYSLLVFGKDEDVTLQMVTIERAGDGNVSFYNFKPDYNLVDMVIKFALLIENYSSKGEEITPEVY